MEWFENKTTQIIALVGIVGTLAGFGYTGATYVNRLESLEGAIGGIDDTENAQQIIEERFVGIETSVSVMAENANGMGKDIVALQTEIEYLQESIDTLKEGNKNPLAN
jgi:hypothetical protein